MLQHLCCLARKCAGVQLHSGQSQSTEALSVQGRPPSSAPVGRGADGVVAMA
jgi:hypothetical protein